jgi:hypothetical protein
MAGFVQQYLFLARPFGWLDQVEGLPARELAPTLRKFRTALRITRRAIFGASLIPICHVYNELGTSPKYWSSPTMLSWRGAPA